MLYNRIYNVFWQRFIGITVLLQIIANCDLGAGALKNVTLIVDPTTVRRSHHATLRCLYDLEGAPLYSVKFYRGPREFYQYLPSRDPSHQTFPFPGINVDTTLSNASQVVIKNVGFGLSGNFSCEVSAEAPSFSTAEVSTHLQVVELPETRPALWTEHDRYEPGDVLRANCSSPPSKPRADLSFTLNNIVMFSGETQHQTTPDNLMSSKIGLRLQLQSSHFGGPVPSPGSSLVLRCTAQIGNLYQEYSEIELGVPQRDPIPARVTSSGSIKTTTGSDGILTLFLLFTIILHQLHCWR